MVPVLAAAFFLVGCENGNPCFQLVDQRARHLIFQSCLEASASIITADSASRSEAHETVKQCESAAYYQSLYRSCGPEQKRPGITVEWLQSLEQGED
ncbi:MAG: hypothetical protein AAGM33_10475 [Pseudomonadota bacterium]